MKFRNNSAEIYLPFQIPESEALAKTTHLCVSAHQDDIEIMAAKPILECFQQKDKWFTGVVMTDGRGSPRNGLYEHTTDDEMHGIRKDEQCKAADIGEYTSLVLLDYPSTEIKDPSKNDPVEDLLQVIRATRPEYVYTHNLADKHDTHVAVALRVLSALRKLDPNDRPKRLFGCEVWRSLDWLDDNDKFLMNLSEHENLQHALLGVYDSQIAGGKRYDLAAIGRRRSNATFFESHGVDVMTGVSFAMDLTPLMNESNIQPVDYVNEFIHRFEIDVANRITRMS